MTWFKLICYKVYNTGCCNKESTLEEHVTVRQVRQTEATKILLSYSNSPERLNIMSCEYLFWHRPAGVSFPSSHPHSLNAQNGVKNGVQCCHFLNVLHCLHGAFFWTFSSNQQCWIELLWSCGLTQAMHLSINIDLSITISNCHCLAVSILDKW